MTIQNEKLAEWCKAHPDRFVGLASVALQHPDLAAEQLDEAVKRLGLRGVGIAGHVAGEVPSSPMYDPFWAKAENLASSSSYIPSGRTTSSAKARCEDAAISAISSATRSRRRCFSRA